MKSLASPNGKIVAESFKERSSYPLLLTRVTFAVTHAFPKITTLCKIVKVKIAVRRKTVRDTMLKTSSVTHKKKRKSNKNDTTILHTLNS